MDYATIYQLFGKIEPRSYYSDHGYGENMYLDETHRLCAMHGNILTKILLDIPKYDLSSPNCIPIQNAIISGNLHLLEYLRTKSANLAQTNNLTTKILIKRGPIEVIKFLLDHGAVSTIELDNIDKIIYDDNLEMIELLFDKIKVNELILKSAIDRPAIFELLGSKDILLAQKVLGEYAIKSGNMRLIVYLIEQGLQLTSEMLELAFRYGHFSIFRLLEEHDGVELCLSDESIVEVNMDLIRYLIDKMDSNQLIQCCIRELDQNDIRSLIDKMTPELLNSGLYWALNDFNMDLAEFLIDNGADPNSIQFDRMPASMMHGEFVVRYSPEKLDEWFWEAIWNDIYVDLDMCHFVATHLPHRLNDWYQYMIERRSLINLEQCQFIGTYLPDQLDSLFRIIIRNNWLDLNLFRYFQEQGVDVDAHPTTVLANKFYREILDYYLAIGFDIGPIFETLLMKIFNESDARYLLHLKPDKPVPIKSLLSRFGINFALSMIPDVVSDSDFLFHAIRKNDLGLVQLATYHPSLSHLEAALQIGNREIICYLASFLSNYGSLALQYCAIYLLDEIPEKGLWTAIVYGEQESVDWLLAQGLVPNEEECQLAEIMSLHF